MRLPKSELTNLVNYIFGGTSAITTNISLIVGLGSTHAGKGAIIGSLFTIAVADNISDSLGIHMSKEAEGKGTKLSMLTTLLNFFTRFCISLTFIGIVAFCQDALTAPLAVVWGLFVLTVLSYFIARRNRENPLREIFKHVCVAIAVITASYFLGHFISRYF